MPEKKKRNDPLQAANRTIQTLRVMNHVLTEQQHFLEQALNADRTLDPTQGVSWTKQQEPDHGDPVYIAIVGQYRLTVSVAHPWFWEWYISHPVCGEEARGRVLVGSDVGDDPDDWDYQNVEVAQRRCARVLRAIEAACVAEETS